MLAANVSTAVVGGGHAGSQCQYRPDYSIAGCQAPLHYTTLRPTTGYKALIICGSYARLQFCWVPRQTAASPRLSNYFMKVWPPQPGFGNSCNVPNIPRSPRLV